MFTVAGHEFLFYYYISYDSTINFKAILIAIAEVSGVVKCYLVKTDINYKYIRNNFPSSFNLNRTDEPVAEFGAPFSGSEQIDIHSTGAFEFTEGRRIPGRHSHPFGSLRHVTVIRETPLCGQTTTHGTFQFNYKFIK